MIQEEYFGVGSIKKLKDILLKNKTKNIFLVRGKKSYEISGAKKAIQPLLNKYNVFEFFDFDSNPKIEDIIKGTEKIRKNKIDLVIAIGGGSVIDMAKSVNVFSVQLDGPKAYIKNKKEIKGFGKKLVAIPTTAGSGSEATHFAVVYINKTKYSLANKCLLPNYAIVDPQFTFNLPKKITATTGMDAFSQAIESYWCVNSNEESKKYARKAIELIKKNLPLAVNEKDQFLARLAMSKAANLAGKAINISQTTACHAISYPITSYFNVPHGHATSLTLGSMMVYNSCVCEKDVLDKRGVKYVKKIINDLVEMLDASDIYEAKNKVDNLMKDVGLETKLCVLGIGESGVEIIIKNGFNPDRVKNNPRLLTKKNLRLILKNIL